MFTDGVTFEEQRVYNEMPWDARGWGNLLEASFRIPGLGCGPNMCRGPCTQTPKAGNEIVVGWGEAGEVPLKAGCCMAG